jgi:hypothetical protein
MRRRIALQKHFRAKSAEDACSVFAQAFGVRARPRAAFAAHNAARGGQAGPAETYSPITKK